VVRRASCLLVAPPPLSCLHGENKVCIWGRRCRSEKSLERGQREWV
jgi:hypothetical protein